MAWGKSRKRVEVLRLHHNLVQVNRIVEHVQGGQQIGSHIGYANRTGQLYFGNTNTDRAQLPQGLQRIFKRDRTVANIEAHAQMGAQCRHGLFVAARQSLCQLRHHGGTAHVDPR